MPDPGTRSGIRATMSAKVPWPWARRPATTSARVAVAGRCRPTTPAKMRSVARPRILGPTALRATLVTAKASTAYSEVRSGRIRPIRRLADGPKFCDFSAGMPAPIIGPCR